MADDVSRTDYWRGRWDRGETGWDLGGPCPVFVELIGSDRAPPLEGRLALPGCGQGHDVTLFRDHGYDAVGFDFALESDEPPIERLDVFELGTKYPATFDTIVEYTCYCAIDPARRAEYSDAVFAALKPGGLLVALMVPMGKRDGDGPPFGVEEHEIGGVFGRGMEMLSVETPTSSVERRLGNERLALFRKAD